MVDFTKIQASLSQSMDEVEKPKPMPVGHFTFLVLRHEFGESSKKQTPFVRFFVKPLSPDEDVDAESLAKVNNWQSREMRLDFYITPDALWRLKDFLGHCGVTVQGKSFEAAIPETTNCTFKGYVAQEISSNDPESVFSSIANTMAA